MGTRTDQPVAGDDHVTDAELQQLLDAPETAEERAQLDKLVTDPEEVLRRARERLALRLGRRMTGRL